MKTWEDNADEFGALSRQGKDVRLALLVACSVEKGAGNGRPSKTPSNDGLSGKCSLSTFAEAALGKARGSTHRVSRHLDAWDRMAKAGHVPAADTLTPEDAETFGEVSDDVQAEFAKAFTSVTDEKPSGGRPRASAHEIAEEFGKQPELVQRVVADLTPEAADTLQDTLTTRRLREDPFKDDREAQIAADRLTRRKRSDDDEARWFLNSIMAKVELMHRLGHWDKVVQLRDKLNLLIDAHAMSTGDFTVEDVVGSGS